ncbi:MAG: 23S rRNA (guanosine(2251)-2'-O)-methyltransferase RlmB [Alkalispirochaeta sp.]
MGWITSRHAIRAALEDHQRGTLLVSGKGARNEELVDAAQRAGVEVRVVDARELRRRAGDSARGAALNTEKRSPSTVGVVDLKTWLEEHGSDRESLIIALDHVTDPHNLGAILRSALLMQASIVVVPTRRSASTGDTVHRTSAGASRYVTTTYVPNLRSAIELCRDAGWWLYGADSEGASLHHVEFAAKSVLVLGAEGKGLSPLARKTCDEIVTIPGGAPPESGVDSFNVSVAAGVLMYEYRRQRSS